MSENILSIKNLTIEFKSEDETVRAVKSLNLDIPKGKTVGLVGESGSGKSVTSLAIMGLIPSPPGRISEGEILFNGRDLTKVSQDEMRKIRGNHIGMIFQEPMTSLNPVYTVGNQIDEVLVLHQNKSAKEARKRTIELLDEVGIPTPSESVNKYPHQMSGGQKQRVMIAMAMACEPELLICDEPTTALDVTIQKQVLELMFDLQRKHGMSMLFITHDLAVIADIADEVAVMFRGDLVEKNTTKALFENPQHPYTKGLLACRPSLVENTRRLLTVEDFVGGVATSQDDLEPLKKEIKVARPISETDNPVILEISNFKKYFPIKGGLFGRTIDHFKAVDNINIKVRKNLIRKPSCCPKVYFQFLRCATRRSVRPVKTCRR